MIALLRGVNVGGHNKLPMAELRKACVGLGWKGVTSYIQSGNLVFRADSDAAGLEADLEQLLAEQFGIEVPAIVRSTSQWQSLVGENPFPGASEREANRVMAGLCKGTINPSAAEELAKKAGAGERVNQSASALWIHFPNGSGRSKITPALLDRLTGAPVTSRNWRTVVKLAQIDLEME